MSGQVTDETGEPLIGAAIYVDGREVAISDTVGHFALKAGPKARVEVKYMGFRPLTLPARPHMLVSLKPASEVMEQVVVIGYGHARRADLTGAVSTLRPDGENRTALGSPQEILQGRIAGVDVTTESGAPGAGATIRVRGSSSLHASNQPLIVIDGLAMDQAGVKGLPNALSMVHPADIESFTVLRDASAAAIYGSRGSNGVILITTKGGLAGQAPRLTYSGSVSLSAHTRRPRMMTGDEYRSFVTGYYGEGSLAHKSLGTASTDWQDEVYRTALSHDHHIALSGGLEHMPWRVSASYTGQDGVVRTSGQDRLAASLSLSPSLLSGHLKLSLHARGMAARTRFASDEAPRAALRMDPSNPVWATGRKLDGTAYPAEAYERFGGYFQWTHQAPTLADPEWMYVSGRDLVCNPSALLRYTHDRSDARSLMGDVSAEYLIHGLENLSLHVGAGADLSTGRQLTDADPSIAGEHFYYGLHTRDHEHKCNVSLHARAQYLQDFGSAHQIHATAGYEWQHFRRSGSLRGSGFYQPTSQATDDAGRPLAGQPANPRDEVWKTESFLVSFFGRAGYVFHQRYMATATLRADGSSRFSHHWALFPSLALAWRISDEPFLSQASALSDLKLRLSWGRVGQQEGIGDYLHIPSYTVNSSPSSFYPAVGQSGHTCMPNAWNPDLRWETTTTWNVGLDWGLWGNRFTGSLDLYHRHTTDLIADVDVPAGTNFANRMKSNIGTLQNRGVELSLTWHPIDTKHLS